MVFQVVAMRFPCRCCCCRWCWCWCCWSSCCRSDVVCRRCCCSSSYNWWTVCHNQTVSATLPTPSHTGPVLLINSSKSLASLNGLDQFIFELQVSLVGWQVQTIEAKRVEKAFQINPNCCKSQTLSYQVCARGKLLGVPHFSMVNICGPFDP